MRVGRSLVLLVLGLCALPGTPARAGVNSGAVFAPAEGVVRPQERPYRRELCLNGRWQFQPAAVPPGYRRGAGAPPELSRPRAAAWDRTPIKIPSPWNVNAWGTGHPTGDPARPYDPGSTYFPSYPAAWSGVEMAWLRRSFRVPSGWKTGRLSIHFEAVAGECQVWVNGRRAGGHFDSWLPFDLDVTPFVSRTGVNELLVGVRAHALFDKRSTRYPLMRAPYPIGSETERLAGIWQDVYLLNLPPVHVADVFIRPDVSRDSLALEVTVANTTDRPRRIRVTGEARPWLPSMRTDAPGYPQRRWRLGAPALALPGSEHVVPPGRSVRIAVRQRVQGRLRRWAPGSPRLYAALLTVTENGRILDRRSERFGWRQFTIRGRELLLNGRPIRLSGDLLHPFGPFVLSRSYAWAWYRAIQDFGGNCVRPHAQVHPKHYLELADEMGLLVLDETSLFGSSVALNFEEPVAWERFAQHYDGLVLRDRNHPSVLGWSVGNELFAIFDLNHVGKEDADRWYGALGKLALRARELDPTRPWISCDGDEDLRGVLPVWSKHFGHGLFLDRLPDVGKPLMVGESGGSYYARPAQLAAFNGQRAYESYTGRNEALAIDLYENIIRMARPKLAYFSASETAWFGLEHLGYGYRDRHRLPTERDGIFFTRPFEEGRPGIQLERLPPFVSTLNPGWDPALPLYRPLPMFRAAQAALALPHPRPLPWARRPLPAPTPPAGPPVFGQAALLGSGGELRRRLTSLGVSVHGGANSAPGGFTIMDGLPSAAGGAPLKAALDRLKQEGGVLLWMLGAGALHPEALDPWLPAPVRLAPRSATALVPDRSHPWTRSFTLPDLYFAEDGGNRFLQRFGLAGRLVEQGRVLLRASGTDWSLFNDRPENVKCGAVVLDEQLVKPPGAALVEVPYGKGKIALCTVDYRVRSRAADAFWRRLFAGMGLKLNASQPFQDAFEADALVNALTVGRFGAADPDTAFTRDSIGEAGGAPVKGALKGGLIWKAVTSPSRDRFILHEQGQQGPERAFAVYYSFWIRSPRALDDLLTGGPDVPRFGLRCFVSERARLFLNGGEVTPARQEPADYRTLDTYEPLPLKKGWNHFLIKVVSDHLRGEHPATLAVRMFSTSDAYLRDLDTAVELDPAALPGR